MRRKLVQRGGHSQDLRRHVARSSHHIQDARAAHGQGPRLVQQEGAGPAQVFQRSAIPDDHTAAGGTGKTGDDGHRSSQ